jgi:hypothetical protein
MVDEEKAAADSTRDRILHVAFEDVDFATQERKRIMMRIAKRVSYELHDVERTVPYR